MRDKKELVSKEDSPGRYYVPYADIYETDEVTLRGDGNAGRQRKDVDVGLENGVLRVDGRIDFSEYKGMEPV